MSESQTTVGFLGLGRMGAPMACRLAGHVDRLLVHDISPGPVEMVVAKGAEAAGSAAALGDRCDIVFMSLPTPPVVRDAVAEVITGGTPRIMVDLSTSGPRLAQELHDLLAPRGVASFDAPVSGGIRGAELGSLAIMVGGPAALYEEIRGALDRIGNPYFMGEQPGAGQVAKLANNLLSAAALAVTAEVMAMGTKAGLDARLLIDIINAGSGRNSATEDKYPRAILPRTFDFGMKTGLFLKDIRLCIAEAEALGVPMIAGEAVRQLFAITQARFGPASDFTEIGRLFED